MAYGQLGKMVLTTFVFCAQKYFIFNNAHHILAFDITKKKKKR